MRKIMLALLFVSVAGFSYGQGFRFGPKAGVNISNYTGGNVKSDALVGAHVGGLLSFGIGNVFSIQPEVLFSTQGAKMEDISGATQNKESYKVNYVTVPVMLKLKSGAGLYIEAGPQVSFKTGQKAGDKSINDFANDLDLAAGAGIGYQSGIGLGIGARYIAGLSKVGDFTPSAGQINPDFKNSVIQVSVFWAIGGK